MGSVGPFVRLDGTAYFEVDPKDPHNAIIVNLDKAPKNAHGMVEFSAPFYIIKPTDMAKGNRKIFYGINNRGSQTAYGGRRHPSLPLGVGDEILSSQSVSDALIFKEGYSYVDAGWHGDGIPAPGKIFANFPIATNNGQPITGPLRVELQPTKDTYSLPLVEGFRPYPSANPTSAGSTLTVRDTQDGKPVTIPAKSWTFGICPAGQASLKPSLTDVCLFDGFKASKVYELFYTAKDPIVMGLAYAVTRDLASFLRNQTKDDAGNLNPLRPNEAEPPIKRIYAAGGSSTGMYSREYLYLGFNADEAGRRVFDAMTLNTAGANRLFANIQFASPTYYSGQSQHHDYTSTAYPPFTYAVTTDPISGIEDGILKRPETDPYVMQIDGAYEFWDWRASLNVTDGLGNSLPVHEKVRLYFLNGAQHGSSGAGLFAPAANAASCKYPIQSVYASATQRALTIAMDHWVDKGIEPPPSRYPTIENQGLVTAEEYRKLFPKISGVDQVAFENPLRVMDFGSGFSPTGGIQTKLPPARGANYKILYPRPDKDGNDLNGVGQMEAAVPLGTNVGWNFRAAASRKLESCNLLGAYFPFVKTAAERKKIGDPRLSLEERYGSHDGFVKAATAAAKNLVKERLMLQQDADDFIKAAASSDVLR